MNKLTRIRPWNRVNQPVYSISSAFEGKINMNICTYAVPVSLQPKQYVVAIYNNTFTQQLVRARKEFVLQFLTSRHATLIQQLGRTSGFTENKLHNIAGIEFYQEFPILRGIAAYVHLTVIGSIASGDHECMLCQVVHSRNINNRRILTTAYLKKEGVIRA